MFYLAFVFIFLGLQCAEINQGCLECDNQG